MNQKNTEVQIKPAKGRPMLTWVGKRPLRNVMAYPAQLVETYGADNKLNNLIPDLWQDWPGEYPQGGLLFHGDNKEVLAHLLANGFRGKVKLIYIDPPFDSGADYVRKLTLRGSTGTAKLNGEGYVLGEQIQYMDIWANDNYLQFMYERLLLLKELLIESGSVWLHCDPNRSHYLKILLDEIFGPEQFINEVIWKRSGAKGLTSNQFPDSHDTLLYYCKDRNSHQWQRVRGEYDQIHLDKFRYIDERTGRHYMMDNLQNPNPNRPNLTYQWNGHLRCWRWTKERMQKMHDSNNIAYAKNGMPYLKRYLDELAGPTLTDTWIDISPINSQASERENYPTQKPEQLIERVIQTATDSGDLVLDCFIGSGTTAAVAQKMGRRWIGCDINKGAIQTTSKRLSDILKDHSKAIKTPKSPQLPSMDDEKEELPEPTQLSFTVFRVNDYDLQIQHNEAVNLACEHIGITRTKTDAFFDGALGKRLVKIIPFNHPLSPLDLEEIKKELGNRPEEERDIAVVCLGKELAVEAWLEDWNRLRKQGNFPNKIEVVELRSDSRYGGFFTHKPAQAQIKVQRTDQGIEITIEAFISPSIIERLKQQAGLLTPQIDDCRAMVDSVMIDTAYDGEVFNAVMADVPEKKSDLVAGKYILPAPEGETTVAVKITDMLGEEVLVIQQV
jgi:DNA modification methylase